MANGQDFVQKKRRRQDFFCEKTVVQAKGTKENGK